MSACESRTIICSAITCADARAAKAGLPVVRFYTLRHGHAIIGYAEGVLLEVMSERLGRSSIRITADTCSHVTAATDRAAVRM